MKKDAIKGTIGFFFYFLFSYLQLLPLQLMNINYNNLSIYQKEIYLIFYSIFGIIVIFLLFKKDLICMFKDFKLNIKFFLKNYINYWFLILGIMIVSNIIILGFTDNIAANEQTIRDIFKVAPYYTIFSACIFAPFVEEMIFRYSLSKVFLNKKLFIIISGLVFGALHIVSNYSGISDLLYLIPYSAPGFIFAYILTKSNNIFNAISIHFIHNTFLITLQFVLYLVGV